MLASALAQRTLPPVLVEIEVENVVIYFDDENDKTKWATDPNMVNARPIRNFHRTQGVGDIVSVNGKPARGNFYIAANYLITGTNSVPGNNIGDALRNPNLLHTYDIQQADQTMVGSIWAVGFAGTSVPGAPPGWAQNMAIIGGTGPFIGMRGQLNSRNPTGSRQASMTEDPNNRRVHGGGRWRHLLTLFPMERPEIVAVMHADSSPVTAASPARKGETLTARVTGLGPTIPGIDPGRPFPADPPQVVNSPLDLKVNGTDVANVSAIGWPGFWNVYGLSFRVPDDTPPGTATIQLAVAWIPAPAVEIPVQ